MDPINVLLILLGIAIIAYAINKYGTQDVLLESNGEILTARRLKLTRQTLLYSIPGIILILLGVSFKIVPEGKRAVIHNRITDSYTVKGPGIFFYIPYAMEITTYDTRIMTFPEKKALSIWSPSSDGINVGVSVRVLYRIDPSKLLIYHEKVGSNSPEEIVKVLVQGTMKSLIAKYEGMKLYTSMKSQLQREAHSILSSKLSRYGISLEDLIVEEVKLSPELTRNVEKIYLSKQEAERIKYELEKKRAEKQIKELEASITAEEIRTIGRELKRYPEYIKYRYIEKLGDKVKLIISNEKSIIDASGVK